MYSLHQSIYSLPSVSNEVCIIIRCVDKYILSKEEENSQNEEE